jgi:hypothetical protein
MLIENKQVYFIFHKNVACHWTTRACLIEFYSHKKLVRPCKLKGRVKKLLLYTTTFSLESESNVREGTRTTVAGCRRTIKCLYYAYAFEEFLFYWISFCSDVCVIHLILEKLLLWLCMCTFSSKVWRVM